MNIKISYIAGRPLSHETVLKDPLYRNYSKPSICLEQLDHQIELFEHYTGLSAFAAYCSPTGYLFIRAFGQSEVKRIAFDTHLTGQWGVGSVWVEDPSRAASEISNAIEGARGVPVVRSDVQEGNVIVYYYAKEKLHISFEFETAYALGEDCEDQKETVSQFVSKFNGTAIYQICASSDTFPMPGKELFNLVMMPYPFMFSQIRSLYLIESPTKFDSLQDCKTALPQQIGLYQNELRYQIYTAMCTLRDRDEGYAINLYGRK